MKALPPPLLLQFLGTGAEGDALENLLQKLTSSQESSSSSSTSTSTSTSTSNVFSTSSLSVRTAVPCRTCVTLVDTVKGEATEIVEPSGK